MHKLRLAALAVVSMPLMAAATPTYKQARDLYDRMAAPVSATGTWTKQPEAARLGKVREATALLQEVERTLSKGPFERFGQCWIAAHWSREYVTALNDLTLLYEGRAPLRHDLQLLGPVLQAFNFGKHHAACRDQIEVLDTPKAAAKR
jgi:hypothetical protein